MADIKSTLPTTDSSDGTDGATAPANTIQVGGKDGSGNLQTLLTDSTGQLASEDIINTSLTFTNISVTTTATAIRVGGSNLTNRKMLTFQPTNGTIYIGGSNTVTTTTGTPIFLNQTVSLALGAGVTIFAIAASTINVTVMEGS